MEVSLMNRIFGTRIKNKSRKAEPNLTKAIIDHTYTIESIETNDKEMENFLFSLGCFKGEDVTVISVLADNYIISIKDSRYSIDADLARAIII